MTGKYLYSICILLSIILNTESQKVIISGIAPDYAEIILYPYIYSDEITYLEEELDPIYIDDSGKFTLEIDIIDTKQLFIPLGANKGFLFIEPYTEYEIMLPPRQDKELRDKLNPYYIEPEIHIGILNAWTKGDINEENELNFLINSFDNTYESIFNQINLNTYFSNNLNIDSICDQLQQIFIDAENQYFNAYKKYKIGVLKHANSVKPIPNKFIKVYFENKPILYNNPAYMELFHLVFDKFIINYLENKKTRQKLEEALVEKSYDKLVNAFTIEDSKLNESISEFVLLKEIHDGLYSNEFPKDLLLQIIDSLYFNSIIPEHNYIAQNIREKTTSLLPGYSPPEFSLTGVNNDLFGLEYFKGKYVYLNFVSTQSLACVKEFNILNTLQEKYNEIMNVVSISVDESFENTIFYIEKKELKWTFLHYDNNPRILKKYNVKAYPTYYLIDPEGKILLSPAPSPEENFEIKFYEILKSKGLF
ncbi:TlpA family protein disulfide reductase [Bacteroidota bacterium]